MLALANDKFLTKEIIGNHRMVQLLKHNAAQHSVLRTEVSVLQYKMMGFDPGPPARAAEPGRALRSTGAGTLNPAARHLLGCTGPREPHAGQAGGSLRVFKQFSWLRVGSDKATLSHPAHQRVPRQTAPGHTQAVGQTERKEARP